MTRADRWMVAGAWTLFAVCGIVGTWKISRAPEVEPWVVEFEQRWKVESKKLHEPPPARTFTARPPPLGPLMAGFVEPDPFAGSIVPRPVYVVVPLREVTVQILPTACHYSVAADLGGAVVRWELEDVLAELPRNARRTSAKPAAILIERASEGEERRAVATVEPKSTLYADLTVEPNRTYRYWVVVAGPEVVMDGRDTVRRVPDVRKEPDGSEEALTPPAHRVAIIGGDVRVATLRVDRYDRAQKAWVAKVLNAKPGEKIGTSGWVLDGLRTVPGRFGTPALVADVTDETGARKTLSREE